MSGCGPVRGRWLRAAPPVGSREYCRTHARSTASRRPCGGVGLRVKACCQPAPEPCLVPNVRQQARACCWGAGSTVGPAPTLPHSCSNFAGTCYSSLTCTPSRCCCCCLQAPLRSSALNTRAVMSQHWCRCGRPWPAVLQPGQRWGLDARGQGVGFVELSLGSIITPGTSHLPTGHQCPCMPPAGGHALLQHVIQHATA